MDTHIIVNGLFALFQSFPSGKKTKRRKTDLFDESQYGDWMVARWIKFRYQTNHTGMDRKVVVTGSWTRQLELPAINLNDNQGSHWTVVTT